MCDTQRLSETPDIINKGGQAISSLAGGMHKLQTLHKVTG